MDRSLDSLQPQFRVIVFELLARTIEAGIPVLIVDTLRTQDEQTAALARGVSWVQHSLHQEGLAIDICPYYVWQEAGPDKLQWDATDPMWAKLGKIGEALGLRWGGRWKDEHGNPRPDAGHFEYVTPSIAKVPV